MDFLDARSTYNTYFTLVWIYHDQVAWDIITEARKACTGKRAVMFVEYSYCHYDQVFYAYVLNDQVRTVPLT